MRDFRNYLVLVVFPLVLLTAVVWGSVYVIGWVRSVELDTGHNTLADEHQKIRMESALEEDPIIIKANSTTDPTAKALLEQDLNAIRARTLKKVNLLYQQHDRRSPFASLQLSD